MHKYTPPEADLEDSGNNNIYPVLEKISNGSLLHRLRSKLVDRQGCLALNSSQAAIVTRYLSRHHQTHKRSHPKDSRQFGIMTNARRAVVVGISGCSSSGKTTISRLLRDIFPNTFVLHEDDFYLPEAE
jgi:ABC-type glutathione transport system ATPase component